MDGAETTGGEPITEEGIDCPARGNRAAGRRLPGPRWRRGSRSPARKATSRRTPSTTSPRKTRPISRPRSSACASACAPPSWSRSTATADTFAFGRTAEVLDEAKGEVNTWTLVGSTEANLAEGRLSAESPIGRALLNAKVGKPIKIETPKGARTFVVQKLVG